MPDARDLTKEVEQQWRTCAERALEQGLRLPREPEFLAAIDKVWEGSDYVVQSCLRDPHLLGWLLSEGRLTQRLAPGEIDSGLQQALVDVGDEPALAQTLRGFRRKQLVRIIWRDLAGWAPLGETLEDLSALADACVDQALDLLYRWTVSELGIPRDSKGQPQRMVVLGMGKLGARELNLSSDIDLIFAFPDARGHVDGPRALTPEQFFVRLGQRLVQALNAQTVDGFVFRVDTRLRPFGEAGPLAMSFGAMEDYYQSQAREWERYAMIKARVVAGDSQAGAHLTAMLRPFVYRRYLDFGAIESLREMKALISKELVRKGMADNIKLGPGGIREIEFIGQAFQLIRGGRDPDLQMRPILPVLERLGDKRLLPAYVVRELTRAYEFLRQVENRLQAWQDRQTHLLPQQALPRLRLARAMGYDDWTSFHRDLERHRQRVQGHFDKVFAAPHTDREHPERPLGAIWRRELDDSQALEVLAEDGFRQPQHALKELVQFRDTVARKGLSRRGAGRLENLMPMLLQAVASSETPDLSLQRILKLLEAIVQRTSYLALLVENPIALSQLVRLTGISSWIAERLARHPLLLDELLDPRHLYSPLHRADLEQELEALMAPLAEDDLEQQMERLRQFAQGNMLRVAAADLTEAIPLMVVSDYLTEIAEVVLGRVLDQTWRHLSRRHGEPTQVPPDSKGFAVIGYGKLGGIELGYGSDLDLVFLHGSESLTAMTDGDHPIPNEQFFMRLGQRMIHMLTTHTPSGILYEVDMRLRPDGAKGVLVRSLNSFAQYQAEEAWTWEHQALVRARPVAGDPVMRARFQAIRREIIRREREPAQLRSAVREMRERMRQQLDKTRDGRFDLKQGQGGIADIEFMVQYSVLRWAYLHPDLAGWTDNIRLLETLSRLDLLPNRAADQLTRAYKALRVAYHRSSLQDQPTMIRNDQLEEDRARVRTIWRDLFED